MIIKLSWQIALVACAHAGFLFVTYATSFFGMHVQAFFEFAIWIIATVAALEAYWAVFERSSLWATVPRRSFWLATCSTTLALGSLYVGLFLAVNTFGT